MRSLPILFAAVVAAIASPGIASAHGGGLNSEGCHNNRKTGDYHCHRSPSASAAAPNKFSPVPRNGLSPTGPTPNSGTFRNCSEARAAGAAPMRRGDPGYGPHLDRDNDGIGCE